MDSYLNKSQRTVAQMLILGKSDDEIANETGLHLQTVKKLKKELDDKFKNLYKYELILNEKIKEITFNENDIGLLKQIFLDKYFN